jgi:catechol 2,3-dioxygenase-like lactoylglutathione lyase family enzyme
MAAQRIGTGAGPASTESVSPAAKPAALDLEQARAGLRQAAPVTARCIDHVNISVRDLDVSADFYARLLGIELKEQGGSGGARWCILGARDRFYVCLCEGGAGNFKPGEIHINHVGFVVDDIDETVDRIRGLGLQLESGKTLDWSRSRSAYVRDPDGIQIEFTNRFGGGLD